MNPNKHLGKILENPVFNGNICKSLRFLETVQHPVRYEDHNKMEMLLSWEGQVVSLMVAIILCVRCLGCCDLRNWNRLEPGLCSWDCGWIWIWLWKNILPKQPDMTQEPHLRRRATYLWGKGRPQFANEVVRIVTTQTEVEEDWLYDMIWYELRIDILSYLSDIFPALQGLLIHPQVFFFVYSTPSEPLLTSLMQNVSKSLTLVRNKHLMMLVPRTFDHWRCLFSKTTAAHHVIHLGSLPDDPTLIYHSLHPTLIYMYHTNMYDISSSTPTVCRINQT